MENCRGAAYLNPSLEPIASRWAAPAQLFVMNDMTKITIAVGLIIIGIVGLCIHINEYRKDEHTALKYEFLDFFFVFPFAGFIFPLALIIIGVGWLHYLLKSM